MTTLPFPSEPTVTLRWCDGTDRCARTFSVGDPNWRALLKSLAAVPTARVRLLYDRTAA